MPVNFNKGVDPIKWKITGELSIKKQDDITQDMTWKGDFTKVLANVTHTAVYNKTGSYPVGWSAVYAIPSGTVVSPGAKLEYTGTSTGVTPGGVSYTFKIDDEHPLVKEFVCSPDKVVGVVSTVTVPITIYPVYSERHPFVNGVASFTTGGKPDARKIEFGLEGTPACDDAGTVTIKGISYPLDFTK
jgi:hypothetical protein